MVCFISGGLEGEEGGREAPLRGSKPYPSILYIAEYSNIYLEQRLHPSVILQK